jgi:hypothetical protein
MRRYVYLPEANPYVFHMELKGEALKAVGVLEQITGLFAAQRIQYSSWELRALEKT